MSEINNEKKTLKVKLCGGKSPRYMTSGAACADCYAAESKVIKARTNGLVSLGIAFEIPEGYEIELRSRSGLGRKGISLERGTIDSDYRGVVSANIINMTDEDFEVNEGDRICQMKFQKAEQCDIEIVEELSETERGDGGFGHTGMK